MKAAPIQNPFMPMEQPMQNIQQLVNNPLLTQMGDQLIRSQIPSSYFSPREMIINSSTRYYFDVDNQYVVRKLMVVFFPFVFKGTWGKNSQEYSQDHQGFLSPKNELHAADLFIPLMALMTFVLGICFSRGIGDQFQPDLIGDYLTATMALLLIEMLLIKTVFFMVKLNEASCLDILSHISYKFAILSFLKVLTFFSSPYIISLLQVYFLFVNALFLYKTLQRYAQNQMSVHLGTESDSSKVILASVLLDVLFMVLLYYICL